MDELIFDRIQSDVEYALNNPDSSSFLKGAYNYTDFNRIESWCGYIANELTSYGYTVSITTKTNWTMSDFPTKTETRRILANIQTLINAFDPNIDGASDLNILYFEKMTYQKANKIEEILYNLNKLFENMLVSFRYSGTFYSGESEGLL